MITVCYNQSFVNQLIGIGIGIEYELLCIYLVFTPLIGV